MRSKILVFLLVATLLGCSLVTAAAETENVAMIGTVGYSTLQAAVNAYTEGETPIQLLADIEETVSVSKNVYLDLNGFDVTGKVTVAAGTLYCMDSQTDDYTVEDAAGYGKLKNVSGSIAGVPESAACAEDGYLMITEDNAVSFHRVNLQIYAMTLRADKAGVYYKSHFAADEMVAQRVGSYGVALSVEAVPTRRNLDEACRYSVFTDFQAGINNQNSTLLQNIMEEKDSQQANDENGKTPVYGRAYILTDEGAYLFGAAVKRSLADQVKLAASNEYWKTLTEGKKDSLVAMYRKYAQVMRNWQVSSVESYMSLNTDDPLVTDKSLKVLAVTSSFGLNTTQLLYDVAVAEGYAPENVTVARLYTSGCTLEKHITYAPNKPVYQYTIVSGNPDVVAEHTGMVAGKLFTVKTEGNATLLEGLQDEQWDIIFMQQGARVSCIMDSYTDSQGRDYITQLRDIMQPYVDEHCPNARFVWNMLWAYDEGSPQYPYNTTFNSDQMAMYRANIDTTMAYVIPRTDYDRIIPTGTAIQNARTSYFGETLSRDTYHLNNLGGTIAAYGLFAVLTGQEITQVNLDIVTASNKNGIGSAAKITNPFTEKEKLVIMESVNNALRNPYGVTESQYPPVDYSSYNYTDDLKFVEGTKIAVCPACKAEKTWVEINQKNVKELESQGLLCASLQASYHFYLSEDVEFTANSASSSVFHLGGSGASVCVHLNGNDLTATNCAISIMAGNNKLNMMGTGIVSGNHTHATQKFRGSAFVLNSGNAITNPAVLRLYSGTYVQPAGNTQWAPVATSFQGGMLEIFEDVTVTGNANGYSVAMNTTNVKGTNTKVACDEVVNIYGGTFNRPVYAEDALYTSLQNTELNISGGTFNDGIIIDDHTNLNLTGSPVIKGAGLVIPKGVIITLETLEAGASIRVDAEGLFTIANPLSSDYVKYFTPVKSGYQILAKDNVLYCEAAS